LGQKSVLQQSCHVIWLAKL